MAHRALGPATLRAAQAVAALAVGSRSPLRWVVCCSGGPDSLALAASVRSALPMLDRPSVLAAAVVDHGLQPGSDRQAAAVGEQLRSLGYRDVVIRAVDASSAGSGAGPEAAARAARYEALNEVAEARDADLLLGHTLDDQAETVALGLLRGSGPRSLAGMAIRQGRRLRPFLSLRRTDTVAVCTELGLRAWFDPQNDEPGFRRVAVRQRLLPLLQAELGEGVIAALARTAELSRADADLLDELADQLRPKVRRQVDGNPDQLDCPALSAAPRALRTRVLRRWLVEGGCREPEYEHVLAVESLITHWHGQRGIDVPGARVVRRQSRLHLLPAGRDTN